MKPVYFYVEANDELESCVDYYENRRYGLGGDFRVEIESKVLLIGSDPQRWPYFRGTEARKCRLKRFPFTIIYYDSKDRIWIVAVAHQKRKPGYWRNRRPPS